MIRYFCVQNEEQRLKEGSIAARRRFEGLKWLPVGFSPIFGYIDNDLATGSWWFVIGGIVSMLIPLVVLADGELHFFEDERNSEEVIEAAGENLTWWLLLISGFFVTIGSYCFVRAFTEPTPSALGECCVARCSYFSLFGVCIRTDEILASWLFLAGSLPSLPYAGIFYAREPARPAYILGLMAAIASVLCAAFFVWAVIQPVEMEHISEKSTIVSSLSSRTQSSSSFSPPENDEALTTPLTEPSGIVEADDYYIDRHEASLVHENPAKFMPMQVKEPIKYAKNMHFHTVDISTTGTSLSTPRKKRNVGSIRSGSTKHASISPLKSKMIIPVVETVMVNVVGKQQHQFILMHLSTDFLLAAWLSLFVSIAWGLGSLWLLILKNTDMSSRVDFAYSMSFVDSLPFIIGSIYYISGGFYYAGTVPQTDVSERNPLQM